MTDIEDAVLRKHADRTATVGHVDLGIVRNGRPLVVIECKYEAREVSARFRVFEA